MKRKGVVWSEIAWWVIGLAVLALVIVALFFMKGKGFNLIDKIKQLLRF